MRRTLIQWMVVVLLVILKTPGHSQVVALTGESATNPGREFGLVKAIENLVQNGIKVEEQDRLHILTDSLRSIRCNNVLSENMVVWGDREGECLWGDGSLSTLNLANVTANTEGGSIYTDVLTTYFGPVRLGVGTLLAASAEPEGDQPGPDEIQSGRDALQRLVAGGGNLLIGAQYPFLFVPYARWNEFKLTGAVLGRAATDVQALGATADSRSSTAAGAVDIRAQFTSNDSEVALFGYIRGEMIRGSGTLFVLPQPSTAQTPEQVEQLDYIQYSLGARLWNSVLITWTKFDCTACRALGMDSQLSITTQRTIP